MEKSVENSTLGSNLLTHPPRATHSKVRLGYEHLKGPVSGPDPSVEFSTIYFSS